MKHPPDRSFPKVFENEEPNTDKGTHYGGEHQYFKDENIEDYELELAVAVSLKY